MSAPVYELNNLQHHYGTRTVLQIDSLTLHEGEILALVGPNGSGKSTLLRLLALLEAPAEGSLRFCADGQRVSYHNASIHQRRQIAMVFQRPVLLNRNVQDNIKYGLKLHGRDNVPQRIGRILQQLSLSQLARESARSLSGGEIQRVALARALVLEPRILLLDEPTANLDPHHVQLIEEIIRQQHQDHGRTIVLVTHNIFQARRLATRVGLLLNGILVEIAPTEEFFSLPTDSRTAAFVSGEYVY
jgi:tungstate transport system ATP-binding protein